MLRNTRLTAFGSSLRRPTGHTPHSSSFLHVLEPIGNSQNGIQEERTTASKDRGSSALFCGVLNPFASHLPAI